MRRWLLPLALAAVAACSSGPTSGLPYYTGRDFTPRWSPAPARVANFSLITQTGDTLRGRDLRGTISIASFIYTRCSVVCPVLVERLHAVQDAARVWPDVRLVSFSVTPDWDTPQILAAYGRDHQIDAARWTLLTGSRTQIFLAARRFYYADDGRLTGAPDQFLHTEKVLLVDRHGRLRGVYNGTLAADIRHLIGDTAALRATSE
jgi:protein SCO1/2